MQLAEGKIKGQNKVIPVWLLKWWPYLSVTLIALVAKFPYLNNNILFIDEPIYLAQAKRLDSIEAFIYSFQYRSEVKFQWSLVPQLLALAISQDNAILIMRIFGLIAVMIGFCLLITISKQLFNDLLPGFFAVTSWAILINRSYLTTPPLLEYFQTPILLFSFWQFIKGLESEKKAGWPFFWSGFSLAFAGLIKPSALAIVGVFGLTVIFYHPQLNTKWFSWAKLKPIFCLGLGLTIPIAITIGPYLFNTTAWAELKLNIIDISASYEKLDNSSLGKRTIFLLLLFELSNLLLITVTALPFITSRIIFHRKEWSRLDTYQLLLLLTGWGLFAIYAYGQYKEHYLITIFPFLMLFIGYRLRYYLSKITPSRLRLMMVTAFCVWLLLSNLISFQYYYQQLFIERGQTYYDELNGLNLPKMVNYVKDNTKPTDLIWTYYNFPELYWLANRKPATTDPVAGYVVLFHNDFWNKKIVGQLKQEKPTLIIGVDKVHMFLDKPLTLLEVPLVKDFIAENYECNTTIVKDATICTIKPTAKG